MRVAQSRVGALESAGRVQHGVGGCLDALHVSRRALRYSAMVGAGIACVKVLRRVFVPAPSPAKAPVAPAAVAPAQETSAPQEPSLSGGLLKYLVAQLVTLVVLPWLRDNLTAVRVPARLDYWRPSRIFFRWVGLEK